MLKWLFSSSSRTLDDVRFTVFVEVLIFFVFLFFIAMLRPHRIDAAVLIVSLRIRTTYDEKHLVALD